MELLHDEAVALDPCFFSDATLLDRPLQAPITTFLPACGDTGCRICLDTGSKHGIKENQESDTKLLLLLHYYCPKYPTFGPFRTRLQAKIGMLGSWDWDQRDEKLDGFSSIDRSCVEIDWPCCHTIHSTTYQ